MEERPKAKEKASNATCAEGLDTPRGCAPVKNAFGEAGWSQVLRVILQAVFGVLQTVRHQCVYGLIIRTLFGLFVASFKEVPRVDFWEQRARGGCGALDAERPRSAQSAGCCCGTVIPFVNCIEAGPSFLRLFPAL